MLRIKNLLRRKIKGNHEVVRNTQNGIPGVVVSNPENLVIGERVSFGGQVRIFNTATVKIGNDCMIAYGTQFITSTHDTFNHPMSKQRIDRPIEVGNHVWIGTNAIILPGVKIGNFAVIGAGAVITSHVPETAIVAGNPARIIAYRDIKVFDSETTNLDPIVNKGFLPDNKITKEK
jgi:acetyltransferase-like isoleucine patch superfamily enzyme